LVLRRGDLDRVVSTADDTLVGYLDRLADESLESLGTEESILKKVRRALWTELSEGQPSVKRIAAALNMSVRTLQRRLREDDTSFVEVLDEFRREMATGLLRNRELAIYEVAFLLGYSEPSTFHRAFRRWHACSPREYRLAAASA
jgi:AraC-like DNA-binding protein